jgi:hypothetical protein
VLAGILGWLGFPEVRCSTWRHAPGQRDDLDRIEVIAARTPGFFDAWDATIPDGLEGVRASIQTRTRPGSTVVVGADGDTSLLDETGRTCRRLAAPDVGELERLRAEGASYLVLDPSVSLGEHSAFTTYLEQRARLIDETPTCRVYSIETHQT